MYHNLTIFGFCLIFVLVKCNKIELKNIYNFHLNKKIRLHIECQTFLQLEIPKYFNKEILYAKTGSAISRSLHRYSYLLNEIYESDVNCFNTKKLMILQNQLTYDLHYHGFDIQNLKIKFIKEKN